MVVATDIYRKGDFAYNSPMMGGNSTNMGYSTTVGNGMTGAGQQVPAQIHFAPTFKIMNGGSDFSTPDPQPNNNNNSEIINVDSGPSVINPMPIVSGGGEAVIVPEKIDFNKLVIKKTE